LDACELERASKCRACRNSWVDRQFTRLKLAARSFDFAPGSSERPRLSRASGFFRWVRYELGVLLAALGWFFALTVDGWFGRDVGGGDR
jgi:hypothetical protein